MNACTPPSRPARIVWLDLLKVAAIFMMLAVHCTDNVTPAERSEPWYNLWGSLYGSLLRPAIPLFVMVTGALLLPVRENMQTFYRKRIPRVAVPFLLWSVLYNLFPWFTGLLGLDAAVINEFFVWAEPSQAAADALHHVAMIPFTFSLFAVQMWYVYLLIGLYLYLPVFSAWVSQSTAGEQRFFLSIWVVSLFIPYLREFVSADLWGACSWNEFNMLYYFAGFNGYLLLGYYLRHHLTPSARKRVLAAGIPLFAIGYAVTFFGFKTVTAIPGQTAEMVELFYTYCTPNVLLMSLPVFVAAQQLPEPSGIVRRAVISLSGCTLGIWMCHYLFLGPCYQLIAPLPMPTLAKMVICSFLLLMVCWIFVSLIRRTGTFGRWIMG